jgi:hypothetical protein
MDRAFDVDVSLGKFNEPTSHTGHGYIANTSNQMLTTSVRQAIQWGLLFVKHI